MCQSWKLHLRWILDLFLAVQLAVMCQDGAAALTTKPSFILLTC